VREWTVRFETSHPDLRLTENLADEVMEGLKDHMPAVSYGPHTMSASFCVTADSAKRAVELGLRLFRSALQQVGIKQNIVAVEIQTLDDLSRGVKGANFPELVGVAELAAILKVSKQRVSELARLPDFPRPIVHLKSGPVWRKATVIRHMRHWARRPGRPREKGAVPA